MEINSFIFIVFAPLFVVLVPFIISGAESSLLLHSLNRYLSGFCLFEWNCLWSRGKTAAFNIIAWANGCKHILWIYHEMECFEWVEKLWQVLPHLSLWVGAPKKYIYVGVIVQSAINFFSLLSIINLPTSKTCLIAEIMHLH